jgi:hypothetical protein
MLIDRQLVLWIGDMAKSREWLGKINDHDPFSLLPTNHTPETTFWPDLILKLVEYPCVATVFY